MNLHLHVGQSSQLEARYSCTLETELGDVMTPSIITILYGRVVGTGLSLGIFTRFKMKVSLEGSPDLIFGSGQQLEQIAIGSWSLYAFCGSCARYNNPESKNSLLLAHVRAWL